jgi:3-hydroxyisobutyrate dehydrogenase
MTVDLQADAEGQPAADGQPDAGGGKAASEQSSWRVGFVGTGQLGSKIVGRLVGAGVAVVVNDSSEEAAASSLAAGASWAPSPAAAASGADVVMTCLPRPDVVEAVVGGPGGVLESLRQGGCWIDISTNDVAVLKALSARAAELGVATLEAPVTGGVHKAALGELTVLVGGDRAVFADHLPLLQRIGSRVIYLGALGQASRMKVITNMLAFIHLVAVGEALTLAATSGIDLKDAFDAIRFSSGNSFVHETESQIILSGSYDIGFTVDLALKDLGLAMGMASELGVPVQLAPLVEGLFRQAEQRYGGGAWSPRVVQLLEDEVGVSLRAEGFPASLLDGDVTTAGGGAASSVVGS